MTLLKQIGAKVYFQDTAKTDWYAEKLLEYRDPLYERGQDGRVVKASFLCEMLMLSRGINYQVAHLVSTQEVHRLGGWC